MSALCSWASLFSVAILLPELIESVSRLVNLPAIQGPISPAIRSDASDVDTETDTDIIQKLHDIQKSTASDQHKLLALESLGVWSSKRNKAIVPIILWLEPEYWCNTASQVATLGECAFHQLPPSHRLLIMASRIMTQAIYPFVVEIEKISDYIRSKIEISQITTSPVSEGISELYSEVLQLRPLVYFAIIYYETLIHHLDRTPRSAITRLKMKPYCFIRWNKKSIDALKRKYWSRWNCSESIRVQHDHDVMDGHVRYHKILSITSSGCCIDEVTKAVTTSAIMDTALVCQGALYSDIRRPMLFDSTSEFKNEYLRQIVDSALHWYSSQRQTRDLCDELIGVFHHICSDIKTAEIHHYIQQQMSRTDTSHDFANETRSIMNSFRDANRCSYEHQTDDERYIVRHHFLSHTEPSFRALTESLYSAEYV